jgi:hypothetical protein
MKKNILLQVRGWLNSKNYIGIFSKGGAWRGEIKKRVHHCNGEGD